MLILIDGYNVIAPVAPPAASRGRNRATDWLNAERMRLLGRLADRLDPDLARQTCVVFDSATQGRPGGMPNRDAPNRDAPNRGRAEYRARGIDVRFAVNHDEADDLIEELIAAHSSAKRLTIVSSDHRIQAAARRAGAMAVDSHVWLDALLDGHVMLAVRWPPKNRKAAQERDAPDQPQRAHDKPAEPGSDEVERWMRDFGVTGHGLTRNVPGIEEPAEPPGPVQKSDRAGMATQPEKPAKPTKPFAPSKLPPVKPPATDETRIQADNRRQTPPGTPNRPVKRSRKPDRHGNEETDPKRALDGDHPFPEGYGEDLL